MGKVTFNMSVSLDGFVAGPNDEVDQLFGWYFSGEKEIPVQEGRFVLKVSPESAKILEESQQTIGAMVAGKRMFDLSKAWTASLRSPNANSANSSTVAWPTVLSNSLITNSRNSWFSRYRSALAAHMLLSFQIQLALQA